MSDRLYGFWNVGKIILHQPLKKLPVSYAIRNFVAVLTKAPTDPYPETHVSSILRHHTYLLNWIAHIHNNHQHMHTFSIDTIKL